MNDHLTWRKSSHSGDQGNCVEVAEADDAILLRNSNHPDAGTLTLPRDTFAAWLKGCAAGEFDDLG